MDPVTGPFDAQTLLSGDEVEGLLRLLADVSSGHGDDPGVRDAAGAAWTPLGTRAASQAGIAKPTEQTYQRLMDRLRSRARPWHRAWRWSTSSISSSVAMASMLPAAPSPRRRAD